MSTVRADNYANRDGSQSVPAQHVTRGTAKAWLNYKGTATAGVNASLNISSVTANGTGDYTFALAAAMANVNYASSGHGNLASDDGNTAVGQQVKSWGTTGRLATSLRIMSGRHGSGWTSSTFDVVTVDIHGNLA